MSHQTYLNGNSILDYGFCPQGGFFVIDHILQRAAYAYPTSIHAEQAKRAPGSVIASMTIEFNYHCPKKIAIDHYNAVCRTAHPTTHIDAK